MAIVSLLPKPKVQDWPHQSEVGLHGIADIDYQRNLCENYYEASDYGTPSPLGNALVFANRLEQHLLDLQTKNPRPRYAETFELWALLLKGVYLGVLTPREIKLDELKELGQILLREGEYADGFRLQFLTFRGSVVGFNYPSVGFVPSVRLKPETLTALREAVAGKDVEKASEYFVGWVRTFDDKEQGNLVFYPLLYRLAALWNPDAEGPLPRDPSRLFGQGPVLTLTGNPDLPTAVRKITVPLYIGTPIVCEKCGFDITTETGQLDITSPEDCRCPSCSTQQEWLAEYASWIRFDPGRNCYLIYAFQDSPIRRLPYEKYISYVEDGIVVKTGRFELKIRGLVLREETLKCSRLMFFRDGDTVYEPTLPIRGEFYGLADLAENRKPYIDRNSGEYVVLLRVRDWENLVTLRYPPKEVEREEALLLSWPNFILPGWNAFFYLLEATPNLNRAGLTLRTLDPIGRPKLLEGNRGQLTHPFEAFEVVFTQSGKITGQAGVFKTTRTPLTRGEAPVSISLDFGTSSSSLWYRTGDGEPKIIRFADFTEVLIGNRQISDGVVRTASWLPTFKLDDEEAVRSLYLAELDSKDGAPVDVREIMNKMNYFLPSEMVIMPPISAEMLARPISGFRILHGYVSAPQGEVVYELKTLGTEGDPEGRFTYDQIVSRYLELFLLLALATIIRDEPRAGFLKVRATFPRAFTSEKLRAYLTCLERVLKGIGQLTGFATNTTQYIDEARAAAASLTAAEGLTLVVDMGGGTTDVGVFRWARENDGRAARLSPLFIDSLLYGGNAFLRLLADPKEADLFPKPTEQVDFKHRLLWLLREIRIRGFEAVVSSQYRGNSHSKEVMLDLLLRFFQPITHFIGKLFRAKFGDTVSEPITFYLVGNGWSLADALPIQEQGYRTGFREIFRFLLKEEGLTNLTPVLEPGLDGRNGRWPGPKAAIGYGALVAAERDLEREIDQVCEGLGGVQSIVGLDVRYSDGAGHERRLEWKDPVPAELGIAHLRPVLGDLAFDGSVGKLPKSWDFLRFEKGGEIPTLERECAKDITGLERPFVYRSVLVRFLETVYLKQLHRARRI